MQNDFNNRGRQRNVPPNNYRPADRRISAGAPSQDQRRKHTNTNTNPQPSGSRPVGGQRCPSAGAAGTQRPSRAPMQSNPNPNRRPAPKKTLPQSVPNTNTKRNLMLAAVLLVLITICVIIFAVQSCTAKERTDSTVARDSVKLDTPQTSAVGAMQPTALAQYTDSSAVLEIESSYGVLIDIDKKEVIASKNADDKIYPASMTKVMTLVVAMENISNLEDTFTFTSEIIDPLYAENASRAGFSPGEVVVLKDILYGCILPSGADCTSALAVYVAGSEAEFAKMMNEKAASLGLEHTHFANASGLHNDDHYTTCREMAVILEYAAKNEEMRKILSTYKYTTAPTAQHPNGITLTSTLFSRMSGDEAAGVFVQGGKTGYTLEGKNCLATFAANCTETEAPLVRPQYLMVTAYASGEYTPVFDAVNAYKKYCTGTAN